MVSQRGADVGAIVKGPYQSPHLMQWRKPPRGSRRLAASLVEFR
jgi:hypothetical protein